MQKFTVRVLLAILVISSLFVVGCNQSGCNANGQSSYQINCTLNENVLTCEQIFNFYNNLENSVTQLKFNLYANAFRKGAKYSPVLPQYTSQAYPNGINYGQTDILSCYNNGKKLQFSVGGEDLNILVVDLGKEVFPDEKITIQINFTVTLANVVARTGINDSTINLANFYPILCGYDNGFYECVYYGSGDPFFSDCANYQVTLSAPQEYIIAGGGKKQTLSTKNGITTTKFILDNARSFTMVLSSKFQTVCGVVGDTEIVYYYYDDNSPKASLETAIKSLKLFSQKFGEYPYSTYSVVQTAFVQGGMEFPTITFISDNLDERAYQEVIVHETAHQWWQSVVGNNEIEYGFLDEGLAEYSVVVFYENNPEYSLDRKTLIKSAEQTYRVYCSVVDRIDGKVNTSMLRSLKDYSTEYEYVNIAYVKGCIMFEYLRQTIGDKRFFEGLKKYYKEYSFKNATPDDLVGVFEKIGADTNGFFESFYQGKVVI